MYDLGLGDLAQTPQDSCPEILIKFLATRNGRVERTTCCVNFVSSAAKLSTRNIIRENEKPLLFGRSNIIRKSTCIMSQSMTHFTHSADGKCQFSNSVMRDIDWLYFSRHI